MLKPANPWWAMFPRIANGAYDLLRAHVSAELQACYLPKIASGVWTTSMCLTEAQAGSDLGLVRTRAEPLVDGRYAISGAKLFISGGDHDAADNIVHLVLARRSEEHTSELQSLMRISYAVFCLKKKHKPNPK